MRLPGLPLYARLGHMLNTGVATARPTGYGPKSMHARRPRRRLCPTAAETAASAVHCHTTCGCTARTATASRSVLELGSSPPVVRCSTAAPTTCARSGAARATCSSCWRCCPWPGRQLPDGWPCPYMPSTCTSAAVPRLTTRGVAQPHSSERVDQLKPEQPSSATSTPLSARGRMCSQAVFRRDG